MADGLGIISTAELSQDITKIQSTTEVMGRDLDAATHMAEYCYEKISYYENAYNDIKNQLEDIKYNVNKNLRRIGIIYGIMLVAIIVFLFIKMPV